MANTNETIELNITEASLADVPPNTPIVMLNLLRWHEHAQYKANETSHPPCSGQEAYTKRYTPAFTQIAHTIIPENAAQITPAFLGLDAVPLVGPDSEKWDMVALVRYPSIQAFRKVVESEEYTDTALVHRDAALKDWRLFCTVEMKC